MLKVLGLLIFKNTVEINLFFFFEVLDIKFKISDKNFGLSITEMVFLELKIDYVTLICIEA